MPSWNESTSSYKFGMYSVFVSVFLFVIGFATTAWLRTEENLYGLWKICSRSSDVCESTKFGVLTYYDVMRVFQILATIFLLIGVIVAISVNTWSKNTGTAGVVGTVITGGILGCIGDTMYGIGAAYLQAIFRSSAIELSWSFALNTVGSLLSIVSAIIVAATIKTMGNRGHVVHPVMLQQPPGSHVYNSNVAVPLVVQPGVYYNPGQTTTTVGNQPPGFLQTQGQQQQQQQNVTTEQWQVQRPSGSYYIQQPLVASCPPRYEQKN